jgi:hypothetical protein
MRVTKTANPTQVNEPGGNVTFTVVVENTSSTDGITITSLIDNPYGDITKVQGDIKATTCSVPQFIPLKGTPYTCTFTAFVSGNAGQTKTDIVTATATDDDGRPVPPAQDDATVRITDVLPTIEIVKDALPSSPDAVGPQGAPLSEEGASQTYRLTIKNLSVEPLVIQSLVDDKFGDLLAANSLLSSNDCINAKGLSLPAGATATCTFTVKALTFGNADEHVNTVSVQAKDDEGNTAGDSDDATVIEAIGGQGGGGGGGQPPTDMLAPSDALSAVTEGGNPLDGTTSWALWVLLTAALILSGAWVIRRQRFAESYLKK